jgi:long-chain fatty acid transport protein
MNKKILVLSCLLVTGAAEAGGYRVATQGHKALAMGHTGVAMSESSEVVFFNPGGMTQLAADADFTGGITLLTGETVYQNEETLVEEETDNPLGTPINAYYARRYSEQVSWGLGIYTPYGNRVEWPTDWAGSHLVNEIELSTVFFQPTIGYQVNNKTSVGFGPYLAVGTVEFNRNLSTSLTDENGDRSNVTIDESGVTAWGFNVGLLHKLNDRVSLGASYRSEATLEARGGDADFENIPAALAGPDGIADTKFDADLPLPAELTVGIAWQYSDRLTLAFDVNRTFWDVYDELVIEFDNNVPTSVNPRNYEDANIYRFGLQYRANDKWTLRGGIYFDESPVPDGSFAPETPRNDSIGYTAGFTYHASKNLELDFSLLILTFDEEENSYDFYQEPADSGIFIPFSGNYDSAANSIGFGLSYKY